MQRPHYAIDATDDYVRSSSNMLECAQAAAQNRCSPTRSAQRSKISLIVITDYHCLIPLIMVHNIDALITAQRRRLIISFILPKQSCHIY
jgi:hypothetical protein